MIYVEITKEHAIELMCAGLGVEYCANPGYTTRLWYVCDPDEYRVREQHIYRKRVDTFYEGGQAVQA